MWDGNSATLFYSWLLQEFPHLPEVKHTNSASLSLPTHGQVIKMDQLDSWQLRCSVDAENFFSLPFSLKLVIRNTNTFHWILIPWKIYSLGIINQALTFTFLWQEIKFSFKKEWLYINVNTCKTRVESAWERGLLHGATLQGGVDQAP